MLDYYQRMKDSVRRGQEITERGRSGLSGGDSRRVAAHSRGSQVSVLGEAFERSIAYALAALETNAAFGRIVATPTAGSADICPACLLAWQEERDASDERTSRALFTEASIGRVIGHGACFSGAQGGCQAEVGSACAMAAAAVCELDGGTPEQTVNAAALALQNTLGLICDPIGGYVEAPCMMRNGLFGLHAFGAAAISLSGVKSVVPFDEVVGALREVGQKMPRIYKETPWAASQPRRPGGNSNHAWGTHDHTRHYRGEKSAQFTALLPRRWPDVGGCLESVMIGDAAIHSSGSFPSALSPFTVCGPGGSLQAELNAHPDSAGYTHWEGAGKGLRRKRVLFFSCQSLPDLAGASARGAFEWPVPPASAAFPAFRSSPHSANN